MSFGALLATSALGRSRGWLTTKIHVACGGKGRPLATSTNFSEAVSWAATPLRPRTVTAAMATLARLCVELSPSAHEAPLVTWRDPM